MNIKYLETGEKINFLQEIEQDKFLVESIYEDEEGQEFVIEDSARIVKRIFNTPPRQSFDETIIRLKNEIKNLKKRQNIEKENLEKVIKDGQSKLEKFQRINQLKYLEDFIENRISHYLTISMSRIEIIEIKESEKDRRFKLLTLFGDTNGNLEWNLNAYVDGSGYWETIIPCISYNQAVEELKKYIENETRKKDYPEKRIIDAAVKYNIHIDENYINIYKANLISSKNKQIDGLNHQINELKQQIDNL